MGSQASRVHTPGVERWLTTVYRNETNLSLPMIIKVNSEIKFQLMNEASELEKGIKETEILYNQLKFPSEVKDESDYSYWINKYPEECNELIGTFKGSKNETITEEDIKKHREVAYNEAKQNIGFSLLEPGMQLQMVRKVQKAQQCEDLDKMRETYKKKLGGFWDLAYPLIDRYRLREFPSAMAFFYRANGDRL